MEGVQWQGKPVGFSRRTLQALCTVPPAATAQYIVLHKFLLATLVAAYNVPDISFSESAPPVISVRSMRSWFGTYLVETTLARIVLAVSFSRPEPLISACSIRLFWDVLSDPKPR